MRKKGTYRQLAAVILTVLYLVVLSPVQLLHSHHAGGEDPLPVPMEFAKGKLVVQNSPTDVTDCSICTHQYSTYHLESRQYAIVVEAPFCIHHCPPPPIYSTFLSLLSNKGPPLDELSQRLLC